MTGTTGDDVLIGTLGPDVLDGGEGDDILEGLAGDDALIGGPGNDSMSGGTGNDTFYVDSNGDVLVELPDEGLDRVAAAASYVLAGGVEVEILEAITLVATDALDLSGNEFANRVIGNEGKNFLQGGAGTDVLLGLGGNDILFGGEGADEMSGGLGDDTYYIDDASDRINENPGEGFDRVATSVDYTLDASSEVELLEPIGSTDTTALTLRGNGFANRIVGNAGANVIDGGAGDDRLEGGPGDDVLIGGPGNDQMLGGDGNDTYYVDSVDDFVVDFDPEGGASGFDRVATSVSFRLDSALGDIRDSGQIEVLEALNLFSTDPLTLIGNQYDNHIIGNEGDNYLNGHRGNDILQGRGGNDAFVIERYFSGDFPNGNSLMIEDFKPGVDRLEIVSSVNYFEEMRESTGLLSPDVFVVGTSAQDSDDRFIYDPATGTLFYDPDGKTPGTFTFPIEIAVLLGSPELTAADILIV